MLSYHIFILHISLIPLNNVLINIFTKHVLIFFQQTFQNFKQLVHINKQHKTL